MLLHAWYRAGRLQWKKAAQSKLFTIYRHVLI